jgi:hypothetical protein
MKTQPLGSRLAATCLAVGLLACAPGGFDPDEGFLATSEDELAATLPDRRFGEIVRLNGVGLEIPGPGEGVIAESIFQDGSTQILHVQVDLHGRPYLKKANLEEATPDAPNGDEALGTSTQGLAPGACEDGAYNPYDYKWTFAYNWWFNPPPWGTSYKDMAETRIRDGIQNIAHSTNNCGLADLLSISAAYQGRTNRFTDVTYNRTCSARDGVSVVAYQNVDNANTLASTCTWTSHEGAVAVESDVAINAAQYWTWYPNSAACGISYSMEAVMTHEFGHTFGLGHVSETYHPALTMSTRISTCSNAAATLGLGDIRGLRTKY